MPTKTTHTTPSKGLTLAEFRDAFSGLPLAATAFPANVSESQIGRYLHLDGTSFASHVDVGRDRG